ncbi:hypothetical protein CWB89_02400 [Pseudoalteromonas piscicida]|uniref:Beta-lactamase-related domain-containing protein n=1 Tax=Pseudoalteromonas piscicida TaxID=43662 RepID=A0AAQ2EW35_PSEO7|nr:MULTISPECIES: serine hydrolase domain-containing protein [Pseudoalteromonas]KJY87202.1 hypothetical protein TW75_15175 [Pseudoalteromonas piscicida]TMN38420.1 hypothetical protein CWB94_14490 [Pseudoalteromonas piscicida]TMN40394.1 hypothetical protein CWB95_11025 [Pseudoalteromonas piscicida]TMN48466.1 hypothetical protein CWB91_18630 [Pseudoalteromonas piscicida]TMN55798.1 hypothetical protein CWB92_03785 [Pseudoalteromonas piscicida]
MLVRLAYLFLFMWLAISKVQAATTTSLQQQLDKVREMASVPGIAVGIVEAGHPTIVITSGYADIESRRPVTAKTQFRFGSIAKMLVAMSVMKLVEQGTLSLDDRLIDIAPEVEFTNPWSAEYPLRVRHLLNHSTGWDGMHFAENVKVAEQPTSISQALNIHPDSRISRWPPGSRTAYNNNGALIAAYLVEKKSGLPFEQFIEQQFFKPLAMNDSGYFYTDTYRTNAATLYLGNKPLPYEHLNNRAAGGLNSSISDMSNLLRFLLEQGESNNQQLLSEQSFKKIQTPNGTLPTSAGIELTFGQGVNLFHHNGVILYGHEGSVRGGSAILIYQPQLGKGYVIAVNGEGAATAKIHQILAEFITQDTAQPSITSEHFSATQQAMSGFYRLINPSASLVAPFVSLLPWKLTVRDDKAHIHALLGMPPRPLRNAGKRLFAQWSTGKVVLVQTQDPLAGEVLQYGPMTLKRTSGFMAVFPIFIALFWLLLSLMTIVLLLTRLIRKSLKKAPPSLASNKLTWCSIHTIASVIMAFILIVIAKNSTQLTPLVATPSWLSIALFLTTIWYLLVSIWHLFLWWKTNRTQVRAFSYWLATLFTLTNAFVALYLLFNGMIGIRLWQ